MIPENFTLTILFPFPFQCLRIHYTQIPRLNTVAEGQSIRSVPELHMLHCCLILEAWSVAKYFLPLVVVHTA